MSLTQEQNEILILCITSLAVAIASLLTRQHTSFKEFIPGIEKRDHVKLYLKLPSWFTMETPVEAYNPDWAIIMEYPNAQVEPNDSDLLYLGRETKGRIRLNELGRDEKRKIHCGEMHFSCALGVDYRVVTSAGELP